MKILSFQKFKNFFGNFPTLNIGSYRGLIFWYGNLYHFTDNGDPQEKKIAKIWDSLNHGADSGLDADLIRGESPDVFIRRSALTTFSTSDDYTLDFSANLLHQGDNSMSQGDYIIYLANPVLDKIVTVVLPPAAPNWGLSFRPNVCLIGKASTESNYLNVVRIQCIDVDTPRFIGKIEVFDPFLGATISGSQDAAKEF